MRNLGLATLAFAMTFWAWNLIAPLGVRYTEQFGLTSGQKALLVATPVLVGSLGRIVSGALTDRFGGRVMFTCSASPPSRRCCWSPSRATARRTRCCWCSGFFLGIAGTTFAVGIPFVNAWYRAGAARLRHRRLRRRAWAARRCRRSSRRGSSRWFGYTQTHVIIAVALAVVGVDRLVR